MQLSATKKDLFCIESSLNGDAIKAAIYLLISSAVIQTVPFRKQTSLTRCKQEGKHIDWNRKVWVPGWCFSGIRYGQNKEWLFTKLCINAAALNKRITWLYDWGGRYPYDCLGEYNLYWRIPLIIFAGIVGAKSPVLITLILITFTSL